LSLGRLIRAPVFAKILTRYATNANRGARKKLSISRENWSQPTKWGSIRRSKSMPGARVIGLQGR